MSLFYSFIFIVLVTEISCRGFQIEKKGRQLFLSRNVVTESAEFDGGVLVDENGKIAGVYTRESINELLAVDEGSLEVIDGGEWALMAGAVDSHVHVNEPGRTTWEGYVTATRAAAAGGFTTIVDMPLNSIPPTTTIENFKIKTSAAKEEAYVDVAFWGGVVPGNEIELQNLVKAGVVGFKGFLIDSGVSEFPNVDTDDLDKIFSTLNGTNTVLAFHAEYPISKSDDESQCEGCVNSTGIKCKILESSGTLTETCHSDRDCIETEACFKGLCQNPLEFDNVRGVGANYCPVKQRLMCSCPDDYEGDPAVDPYLYSTYLASRPPEMELEAVSLIAKYIPKYDVHVHVVHVSAADVVPILEQARKQRILSGSTRWRGGVTAETCHHYLTLSSEQIPPGHSEYKCSPPIRNITNKLKLWEYIRDRRLDLIASDHSPTVAEKKTSNFMTAWGGISSVQLGVSLFWTEAKARGYSLGAVSHYLSSGPAHLVGLGNRKGALKPGLDADLIFFDPNASFVVTPDIIVYKNKLSPYMYRVLNGKVMQTYLRGQLIYTDGEVFEYPQGQLLVNEDVLSTL